MNNPFTKHPNSVGETYFEHMKIAFNTSIKVQLVVFIILTHAIFPFLYNLIPPPSAPPYALVQCCVVCINTLLLFCLRMTLGSNPVIY